MIRFDELGKVISPGDILLVARKSSDGLCTLDIVKYVSELDEPNEYNMVVGHLQSYVISKKATSKNFMYIFRITSLFDDEQLVRLTEVAKKIISNKSVDDQTIDYLNSIMAEYHED